jgi:hypothetical protein
VEAALDSTNAATASFLGRCRVGHGYLRALQGRHDEAENMMRTGLPMIRGEDPEDAPSTADSHLLWAAARALAGDPDGASAKLNIAARCGSTGADAARYPELAALGSRADYPFESSP